MKERRKEKQRGRIGGGAAAVQYARGAALVLSCAGRLLVGGPACAAAAGVAASDALQVLRVVSCAASDLRGLQV